MFCLLLAVGWDPLGHIAATSGPGMRVTRRRRLFIDLEPFGVVIGF